MEQNYRETDRRSVRAQISDRLDENRKVFQMFGPPDGDEEPSYDWQEWEIRGRCWHREMVETIIPNNEAIVAIVARNMHLTKAGELRVAMGLHNHTQALIARHVHSSPWDDQPRYPVGASHLFLDLTEGGSE